MVIHFPCEWFLTHQRERLQSYPATADSPLSSTLLGVALTTVIFLTFIGFALRRTNVIETSCLALIVAYNIWLCGVEDALVLDPGLQ